MPNQHPKIARTAAKITSFINDEIGVDVTERQVVYLLESRQLPAYNVGSIWHANTASLVRHYADLDRDAVALVAASTRVKQLAAR